MRASPSLVSALSDQLRADNVSMRSFRGGQEPRRSFSMMDKRGHLVCHRSLARILVALTSSTAFLKPSRKYIHKAHVCLIDLEWQRIKGAQLRVCARL